MDSQVGRIWKLKHGKKHSLGESFFWVLGELWGEIFFGSSKKRNLSGGSFRKAKNKEKKTA